MFVSWRRPSDVPGSPTPTAVDRCAGYPTNHESYGPSVVPVLPADGQSESGPKSAALPSVSTGLRGVSPAAPPAGLTAGGHAGGVRSPAATGWTPSDDRWPID